GVLDITNATVDFDELVAVDDPAYVFATYGSLTGIFAPGNILDLPAGYVIDYNYQGGNQIALVIPEPATLGLLALGGMMIATRRSK
ncbi:MAG: PEP-CTERM sorting domain-containing protein, partial [Phycisphaerales bacterium]